MGGGNAYCYWGVGCWQLALVLLGLVLVVVVVARLDCQCLSWLWWIVSVCRDSCFGIVMAVVLGSSMRWVLCGGFGFVVVVLAVSILLDMDLVLGFSRQCGVVARSELVVAMGCSWCE